MKRRQAIQSILGLPALTALAQEKQPAELKPPPVEEIPHLTVIVAETVAAPVHDFFTAEQFETLQRLCDILVPPSSPRPGAADAGVAEFLDFLISRSPQDRQTLYQRGLDRLSTDSKHRFHESFAKASQEQAAQLLAPLREPWTHHGPSDEYSRFLVGVKEDSLRATINSHQWAAASTGRRGARGIGTYWYALD
jgi:hypothetical protein